MKPNYIIFPISLDGPERINNLEVVVKTYHRLSEPIYFVAVLNTTCNPSPEDRARIMACVDYLIEYADGPVFSKTIAYNIALHYISTNEPDRNAIITCVDTDIVIHPSAFWNAYKSLDEGKHECVIPYNGVAAYCVPHVRKRFVECHCNIDYLTSILPSKWFIGASNFNCKIQHLKSPGGIVMFNKSMLMRIGGYHSAFKGWGYEDDEIISRMVRYGIDVARPNEHLHALWHFDHGEGVKAMNPHYHDNHKFVSLTESQTSESIDRTVGRFLRAWFDSPPAYTVEINPLTRHV